MNIQPVGFTSRYKSSYKPPKNRKPNYDEENFNSTLQRINSDVSNPCAYQIRDFQNQIPKIKENTWALEDFYNGKLSYDEFLAQVSFNNICNTINSKYDNTSEIAQKGRIIEQSFLDGDSDSSTYEMVLESIENGELLPNVLFGLNNKAWFKDDFLEDLNAYYNAKATNQDIKETFVPKFVSKGEALDKTPRGGVFCLEDKDYIFIKTDDNNAKELFITPETYLELFPPLEKNALAQGQAGDCYFISSIQALYSNPKTRNIVLEMFKEDPNGSLNVSLSGYKKEGDRVVLKDKNGYELTDVASQIKNYNKKRLSFQYEAMRLLEMCVDKTTRAKAYKDTLEQYNLFCELISSLDSEDDFVEFENGLKYTKKEMELFINLTGDINDFNGVNDRMISIKETFIPSFYKDFFFDEDAIIDTTLVSLEELDYTQEEYQYLECVLNRYKQYFKDNPGAKEVKLNDILTPNCYMAINGECKKFDYVIKGGNPLIVFQKLGLNARKLKEDEIKDFFLKPDLNSNYVMVAIASRAHNEPCIMPAHAYSLRADKIGDMNIICAQNPHNSAKDILMTPQVAAQIFEEVCVVEI